MEPYCFVLAGDHARPYERQGLTFMKASGLLSYVREDTITAYDELIIVFGPSNRVLACGLLKSLGKTGIQLVALRVDSRLPRPLLSDVLFHTIDALKEAIVRGVLLQVRCDRSSTAMFLTQGFQLSHSLRHRDGGLEDVVVHVAKGQLHPTDTHHVRKLDERNPGGLSVCTPCANTDCLGFGAISTASDQVRFEHCSATSDSAPSTVDTFFATGPPLHLLPRRRIQR